MDKPTKPDVQQLEAKLEASFSGRYTQIQCIARGGMAHIFRAYQPALDRFVVIKKLREDLKAQSEEVTERFEREARSLASVLHQNVAHVYDYVDCESGSYIIMEHIDGVDLSTIIRKVGHLPPQVAAAILLGLARGVAYIHDHRLIHRDIKPANVRLTQRGEVKLMDFGIVVDSEAEHLTRPGIMVGSPCYLSPEQVLGETLTPAADIFLLGICLYEMITGSKPFTDGANQSVFAKVREVNYVPPRKMRSQIPKALELIVHRCLKKDPKKRFASVKSLISELETFLGDFQVSHSSDLVLNFLDQEALLTSSHSPNPFFAQENRARSTPFPLTWATVAITAAIAFLAFLAGYHSQDIKRPAPPPIVRTR